MRRLAGPGDEALVPGPGSHRRPSVLLTNDFKSGLPEILRRCARRWLAEESISDQLPFFHLNRTYSSKVMKIDFDLAITVLAHNLYRLLALRLSRAFQHHTAPNLFEHLLSTEADVTLSPTHCRIALKENPNLPVLLEALNNMPTEGIPWLGNRMLKLRGEART